MIHLFGNRQYTVYEETDPSTGKDTSRMLRSGAVKVYYICLPDKEALFEAFTELMAKIPRGTPVICESQSLINYVEPGIFVIMISESSAYPRDITGISKAKHIKMNLEGVTGTGALPFTFTDGKWSIVS